MLRSYFRKYTPFMRVNIMQMFAYRGAVTAWFFVEFFYFIMMIFLWQSIYKDKSSIMGFTIDQIIFYFLMVGLIGIFAQVEAMHTVSQELRQGQISIYLIKPIKYKTRLFFEELGRRIGIASIMVPINLIVIFIAMRVFDVDIHFSPQQVLIFLIFMPLNFLLMYEFSYFFGLLSIYTTNAFGLAILSYIIVAIGSGQLIPLDFYPAAIRPIIDLLPFQFINYYPSMVLLDKIGPLQAFSGMVLLVGWIILFKLINFLMFRSNEKKIVIFGG